MPTTPPPALSPVNHARILEGLARLPCNFTEHASAEGYAFDKMIFSCRAGQRQVPSVLRFAVLFNKLMEKRYALDPTLIERCGRAELLNDLIGSYNSTAGVVDVKRWQLDTDMSDSIRNLVLCVHSGVLNTLRAHLDKFKWSESG